MMMLIRSRQYEKALESIKINPASLGQEFESAHTDAVRSIRAIHHTRKAFRYILYAAICLIVVSFIGLALVDRIKYSTLLNTIFWLYILYSICVLLSMAKLMQNMIFEDRS